MWTHPGLLRGYRALLRIGLVLAVAAAPAAAQLLYGGLVGTVTDPNGAVVPGAKVTIVNTDTNLTRETTSDAQGAFSRAADRCHPTVHAGIDAEGPLHVEPV